MSDPTYKTSGMIQVGRWKTSEHPKDLQTRLDVAEEDAKLQAVRRDRKIYEVARGTGSSRHASNRRRRTREGPEPACVQSPLIPGWHTQEE